MKTPLASFRYVDMPLSEANFTYDYLYNIVKVKKPKLLTLADDECVKPNIKLIIKDEVKVCKKTTKLLAAKSYYIHKSNYCTFKNTTNEITLQNKFNLEKSINELTIEDKFSLENKLSEIDKQQEIQLEDIKCTEINKIDLVKSLIKDYTIEFNRSLLKELSHIKEIFEINIPSSIQLSYYKKLSLNKNNNKNNNKNLTRENMDSLNKPIKKYLDKISIKDFYKIKNATHIDRCTMSEIKKHQSKILNRTDIRKLDKHSNNNRFLIRDTNHFIFKNKYNKLAYRIHSTGIIKCNNKGLNRNFLSNIYKQSNKRLKRCVEYEVYKSKLKLASEKNANSINIFDKKTLIRDKKINIAKGILKDLERFKLIDINSDSKKQLFGDISLPIWKGNIKGLNKILPQNIVKVDNISAFEIIKRWWVLPPGADVDEKILPLDYNYEEHPLIGSSGLGYLRATYPDKSKFDSNEKFELSCKTLIENLKENLKIKYISRKGIIPYNYLPKVYDHHPNSMLINPYMEHDDSHIAIHEISVAINILLEMVNIVALIFHHQSSQFCYCTGQEAMWFIMEMLDDWLAMESTIKKMNSLGSTEHYERAYRWIRWEAEKIFFNCDYEKGKFMGLKYAGQLLANLIEYMKHHHFNKVVYDNIGKLDYWRYKNLNTFTKLDKLKGKRHLNIETRMNRRNF